MGEIFKNVKKEFGKKAGKALGNVIFGKYGEDKRIGLRVENSSSNKRRNRGYEYDSALEAKRIKAAEKRAKRETEAAAKERISARLSQKEQAVIQVNFDPENPKQIINQMTKLASTVELTLKNDKIDDDGIAAAAESKFKAGLALLRASNSRSPMISYFENQLKDWEKYREGEKKSKKTIFLIAIIIFFIAGIVIPFIMSLVS